MPASRLFRASALTVALVLVIGGLGYAAGHQRGSASLTACANAKHRLQVAAHNGSCPKGYHKITLNQTGPRGPRGADGTPGVDGTPGPGAWVSQVRSTSGAAVKDRALAGLNLTAHLVCAPGVGTQSALYLMQDGTDDQSSYQVTGTATVSSGSLLLVYKDDTLHNTPVTAPNPQPVNFTQTYGGNGVASEIIDTGGTLSGDVVVTRGTTSAAIHLDAQLTGGSCFAQAIVTPLT